MITLLRKPYESSQRSVTSPRWLVKLHFLVVRTCRACCVSRITRWFHRGSSIFCSTYSLVFTSDQTSKHRSTWEKVRPDRNLIAFLRLAWKTIGGREKKEREGIRRLVVDQNYTILWLTRDKTNGKKILVVKNVLDRNNVPTFQRSFLFHSFPDGGTILPQIRNFLLPCSRPPFLPRFPGSSVTQFPEIDGERKKQNDLREFRTRTATKNLRRAFTLSLFLHLRRYLHRLGNYCSTGCLV